MRQCITALFLTLILIVVLLLVASASNAEAGDAPGYWQPTFPGSTQCVAHGVAGYNDGDTAPCQTPPAR